MAGGKFCISTCLQFLETQPKVPRTQIKSPNTLTGVNIENQQTTIFSEYYFGVDGTSWISHFSHIANIIGTKVMSALTIKEAPAQSSPETHVTQARVYYQVTTSG